MCDIYANAILTISASDSENCTVGFLQEMSLLQRDGAVMPIFETMVVSATRVFALLASTFRRLSAAAQSLSVHGVSKSGS